MAFAAGALVAAFFGTRDRDVVGWASVGIALILGTAAFIAFGLATGA